MLTFRDLDVRQALAASTGVDLELPLLAFVELETNLRAQVERVRLHPWIKDVAVQGLVYEVETGRLRDIV